MTPESQRIAIAKACGWKWHGDASWTQHWNDPYWGNDETSYAYLPDYLSDLNAMAKAEATLSSEQRADYSSLLEWVMGIELKSARHKRMELIFATAEERAAAFLRTVGKWKGAS